MPQEDMEVTLPGSDAVARTPVRVLSKERLNQDILRLTLECQEPFAYRAGQYVHLKRDDGLIRSYSLASLPQQDTPLELHIRRLPNGAMSAWLHDAVEVGD